MFPASGNLPLVPACDWFSFLPVFGLLFLVPGFDWLSFVPVSGWLFLVPDWFQLVFVFDWFPFCLLSDWLPIVFLQYQSVPVSGPFPLDRFPLISAFGQFLLVPPSQQDAYCGQICCTDVSCAVRTVLVSSLHHHYHQPVDLQTEEEE